MPNFSDAQKQAASQMQTQNDTKEMKDVVSDLRSSSQNLSNTTANQTLQQQQLVQAIQQQSQQIQALTQQVQSSALRQPPPATHMANSRPIIAPAFAQAGAVAGTVGGAVGSHMMARGQQMGGAAFQQYERMRHTGHGVSRGTPGLLHAPNQGAIASAFHATGMSWNPSAAQEYGFGAYQNAQAYNAGRSVQQWGMGAMGTAMGALSAGGLGSMAGGVIGAAVGGPFAPVTAAAGSMIGGAMAAPMDYFNPLSFGMQEAQRSLGFGASSNQNANKFLRGMGGRGGEFGLRQQAQIGAGISDMSMKDLTFGNQDFQQLQGQFADAGLMLGVQGAEDYQRRFRKLMDNTKTIMKALQMSQEEAVQFMDTAFSDIGVNPGQQMSMLASQVGAAAHISGLSPMQTAQMMASGGQGANALGLLNLTGARTMGSAIGLAGTAANGAVNTRTLAAVGGEQGLAGVLAKSQNNFLAGPGGAMGVFGGQGGVFKRMSRLGQVSADDMINFAAAGNEMVDDMMENDPNYARRQMIMDLDQMASMMPGKNHRSKMIMLAQSQLGLGRTEAQGLVDSAKALPATMAKEKMARRNQNTNLAYDQVAEQRGLVNRFRLGAREMMMEDMGGREVRDGVLGAATELGVSAELGIRDFTDKLYGIEGRSKFGSAVLDRVRKEDISGLAGGDVQTDGFSGRARKILNSGSSESRLLKEALNSASGGTKSATVSSVLGGAAKGGAAAGAVTMGVGTAAGAVAGGLDALANPEYDFDIEKMRKVVKAMEQDVPVKTAMELDSLDVSGAMTSSEKRRILEMGREMGFSDEKMSQLKSEMGMKGSGDRIKTEKELAKETMAAFGFHGSFAPEDVNRAFDSPIFQEILGDIDKLMAMHDYNGRNGENPEYQKLKRQIFKKIQKLTTEDPEAADVAKEMLRSKGIKITDNGINVAEAAEKISKDTKSKTGQLEFESNRDHAGKGEHGIFGGALSGKMDSFNSDRTDQARNDSLRKGLDKVGLQGFGSALKDGLQADDTKAIIGDLQGLTPDEIDGLLKGKSKHERVIGNIAVMAQKNKGKLDEKYANALIGSLRNLGASETDPAINAGNIDDSMLGAETVAAFKAIQSHTSDQNQILKTIAEKLK